MLIFSGDTTADFFPESSPFCVSDVTTTQQSTVDQLSTKHGSTGHQETRSSTEQPTTLSGSTVEVQTTKPESTVVHLTTDPVVPGSTVEQLSTMHGSTGQQFTTKTGSSVKKLYTYSESTVQHFTTNPVYIGSTVQQFTTNSGSTVDQLTTKPGSTVDQITTGSSVKHPTTLSGSTLERITTNEISTVEKLTSDSASTVEQFTTRSGMKFGSGTGSTIMQSNISSTTAKPTSWSVESPLERCVQFEKLSSNRAIGVADLGVYTFTTMSECVNQCLTNDMCSAISVESVSGSVLCSTSTDYSTTVFASGHETYYRLYM